MSARGTLPSRGGALGRRSRWSANLHGALGTGPKWDTAEHRGGPQAQSPPGSGPGIQARGLLSPGGGRLRKEGAIESVSTFTLTGLAGRAPPGENESIGHWGRSKNQPRHPVSQRQRATQAKARWTQSTQATGGTTLFTSTACTCPQLLDMGPSPPPAAGGALAPHSGPGPFGLGLWCVIPPPSQHCGHTHNAPSSPDPDDYMGSLQGLGTTTEALVSKPPETSRPVVIATLHSDPLSCEGTGHTGVTFKSPAVMRLHVVS